MYAIIILTWNLTMAIDMKTHYYSTTRALMTNTEISCPFQLHQTFHHDEVLVPKRYLFSFTNLNSFVSSNALHIR